MTQSAEEINPRDFDKLWDYSNPTSTEAKFRTLLSRTPDPDLRLLILTQIARTYSLRRMFDDAHATLDDVERSLMTASPLVSVRYFLERGRSFNSAGKVGGAFQMFERAHKLAIECGEMGFAIDAVHMLAIASQEPEEQIRWNLEGIELCKQHPDHARWLRALYNNLGETYRGTGEYQKSLECFQNLVKWYEDRKLPVDRYTRVDEAKLLRLCNRTGQGLEKITSLRNELQQSGESDGFVEEELAESLEACGRGDEARAHFRHAWETLKSESWIKDSEPGRWQRLQSRGED